MANPKHVQILKSGVKAWNKWREENPFEVPDLIETDLKNAALNGADLRHAVLLSSDLRYAELNKADLREANLSMANLNQAHLGEANLFGVNLGGAAIIDAELRGAVLGRANLVDAVLHGADLRGAYLREADLFNADLSNATLDGADLKGAILVQAILVNTNLCGAVIDSCKIYGASVWDAILDQRTSQHDLIITPDDRDTVTVDDLEVAQFMYLLLNNKKIRSVIDTITSKIVLILGRFTKERKQVLDAIREELRRRDYLPVVFDFDKPDSRDLTETISTLAHIARFVIADVTDAKSIPQELQKIVPNLPSLPVRPIILDGQFEYAMFEDFGGYLSVLPPYRYQDTEHLLESLEEKVIGPALTKAEEIAERRKAFEEELGKQQ